jgi:C4-dicarboxylate transporter DctQ subunit
MKPTRIRKIVDGLILWAAVLGGFLFIVITLIVFYEIVARYVFNSPTTWSIDVSIYLVMWATFLGAAYTLKEGGHIMVDVVLRKFSIRKVHTIRLATYTLVTAFCLVLMWQGTLACIDAVRYGEVTLSAHRFPLWLPMSAIPVGSFLLSLQSVFNIIDSRSSNEKRTQ